MSICKTSLCNRLLKFSNVVIMCLYVRMTVWLFYPILLNPYWLCAWTIFWLHILTIFCRATILVISLGKLIAQFSPSHFTKWDHKKVQTEDISHWVCLCKMQLYNILVINSLQLIQYRSVRRLHCMPRKNFTCRISLFFASLSSLINLVSHGNYVMLNKAIHVGTIYSD